MIKATPDTNIVSELFRANLEVHKKLEEFDTIFISTIVLAELLFGYKNGNREQENRKILKNLLDHKATHLLPVTENTAEIFSDIKLVLRKLGKPIRINDIWIAAHAMETGSTLITFDKHFKHIPGLLTWPKI